MSVMAPLKAAANQLSKPRQMPGLWEEFCVPDLPACDTDGSAPDVRATFPNSVVETIAPVHVLFVMVVVRMERTSERFRHVSRRPGNAVAVMAG